MSQRNLSAISPALERYEQAMFRDVWTRAGLSQRDRSIITLAALVIRGQIGQLTFYTNYALEHGVTPIEVSEIVTHLAFYSGWCNAVEAAEPIGVVFAKRGIGPEQLPLASPKLLLLDPAAEERRAQIVNDSVGPAFSSLVHDTGAVLFRDLWLRPDLAPRDRSLVTVAALLTSGQFAQISFHLNKAMDNGLTQQEAAEMVSHLAYYAGWPNAFSAVSVLKSVFESRT